MSDIRKYFQDLNKPSSVRIVENLGGESYLWLLWWNPEQPID